MPDYAFGSKEADDEVLERAMKRDREDLDIYKMLVSTLSHLEKQNEFNLDKVVPEPVYMWWLGYKQQQRDEIQRRAAIKRLEADAARHGLKVKVE